MHHLLSVTSILLFLSITVRCLHPCGRLSKCALKKCILSESMADAIRTLPQDELFAKLLNSFDLPCIVTKCNDQCRECAHCNYAWQQIVHLLNGQPTEGQCPKLEACSVQCIKVNASKAFDCLQKNSCAIHCIDGDCRQCLAMARHLFVNICRQTNLPKRANINFAGSCVHLYVNLVRNHVSKKVEVLERLPSSVSSDK